MALPYACARHGTTVMRRATVFVPNPNRVIVSRARNVTGSAHAQNPSRRSPQSWKGSMTTAAAAALLGIITASSFFTTPKFHNVPQSAEMPTSNNGIAYEEVQKHKSVDDCWVIIDGMVYDMTSFLHVHPGGAHAILQEAGKDVSRLFSMIHPPNALDSLPTDYCLGPIDAATLPQISEDDELSEEDQRRQDARNEMPPAEEMLLLQDFEGWAEQVLSSVAWAYYRSAADHEATFHENKNAFQRYFFRPRILRDMSDETTETTILGFPSSIPVMISPAAMAKLGHPLGEVNLTKGAGSQGIIQIVSANASCSLEEIFEARQAGQPIFYQLYLNKDRQKSEELLQKVERLGASAIVFTVDVMMQTKRTLDVRTKHLAKKPAPAQTSKDDKAADPPEFKAGVSQAISGYQDFNMTWRDLDLIRRNTKLPIIVKGVQSVEDVQLCVENGVQGVILSNHGGRQADYAPAPIDILYEIRVLRPDLFNKIEIMIDGGIRSGADVVKALALGAKAVGLGRPFLYANGTHGEEGVSRVLQILHEEIRNTMRNVGAGKIEDLKPEMVGPAGPWVGLNRPPYAAWPKA